ncbi:MAG: hypothetical protein IH917_00810 [Acidobacteria bacterium]|nr:hypothetical protein [Acidobacteriota bacterium]
MTLFTRSKYLWVPLLLLALEGAIPRLQAQEFDWGGSFRVYPFLRLEKLALEEEPGGSGPLSRRDTELLILRLTGDAFFGQHVRLEIHPLLEFVSPSRLLGPSGLATSTTPTFLPLEHVFTDSPDVELIGSFDRLNLKIDLNQVRIVIGRQAVTWGVGYFWPSLDLFAPFSPRRVDRDYKPGIDAIRATIPLGAFSEVEVIGAILGPSLSRDGTLAALTRFNLGPLDWGLMGGRFHRDTVAGSFLTADAWGTGLRAEVSWTQSGDPEDRVRDRRTFWRAAAGVDRQLTPTFLVTAEFSFNGYGASQASDYLDWITADRVLRGEINALGRFYTGVSGVWRFHPLGTITHTLLINFQDPSTLWVPSFQWSTSNNSDVLAGAQIGIGKGLQSSGMGPVPQSEYGLVPNTLFAAIRVYF